MSWRQFLKQLPINTTLKQVYIFGIYTGQSVCDICNTLADMKLEITDIYCFDSFQGLPYDNSEPLFQQEWSEGNFDARKHFQTGTIEECIKKTDEFVRNNTKLNTTFHWIPGFFSESLTDNIVNKYKMKQCLYCDIDVDLGKSCDEVLDFMLRNKLLGPGSICGFDDIGGTPRGYGESGSWNRMINKYNLNVVKLMQIGNYRPHIQEYYLLK